MAQSLRIWIRSRLAITAHISKDMGYTPAVGIAPSTIRRLVVDTLETMLKPLKNVIALA